MQIRNESDSKMPIKRTIVGDPNMFFDRTRAKSLVCVQMTKKKRDIANNNQFLKPSVTKDSKHEVTLEVPGQKY